MVFGRPFLGALLRRSQHVRRNGGFYAGPAAPLKVSSGVHAPRASQSTPTCSPCTMLLRTAHLQGWLEPRIVGPLMYQAAAVTEARRRPLSRRRRHAIAFADGAACLRTADCQHIAPAPPVGDRSQSSAAHLSTTCGRLAAAADGRSCGKLSAHPAGSSVRSATQGDLGDLRRVLTPNRSDVLDGSHPGVRWFVADAIRADRQSEQAPIRGSDDQKVTRSRRRVENADGEFCVETPSRLESCRILRISTAHPETAA